MTKGREALPSGVPVKWIERNSRSLHCATLRSG
jgi:hypothetical protein